MRIEKRSAMALWLPVLPILLGVAAAFFPRSCGRQDLAELEDVRRLSGDVVILSYSPQFPDAERVLSLARQTEGVTRADLFAIWPVRVASKAAERPGLLKLETLSKALSQQLRLPSGVTLRGEEQLIDVAVGTLLAQELHVGAHDSITIHVEAGAGAVQSTTVNATVAAVVDWGLMNNNRQLIFADLTHRAAFALHLTGVELMLDPPDLRKGVSTELEVRLGKNYRAVTLEDRMAQRAQASPN